MKILHTSDWHLGKVIHEHSLIEDQRHILEQILDHIKEAESNIPYDLVIVAGDIFDRSVPPADAMSLLSEFFEKLRRIAFDLPLVVISGNHDGALRLSYGGTLFSRSHIHIATDPNQAHIPLSFTGRISEEPVLVFAIPFVHPGSLTLTDEEKLKVEASGAPLEELSLVMDRIDAEIQHIESDSSRPSALRIAISHCFTAGGAQSDSEQIYLGTAGLVPPSLFRLFDYTALGHLHRPQAPAERVRYSGSPLKYSFSECNDTKGVISVDVTSNSCQATPVPLTPLRDMQVIRAASYQMEQEDAFLEFRSCYLEIRSLDEMEQFPSAARLKQRFPHLLSLRRELPPDRSSGGDSRSESERQDHITEEMSPLDVCRRFHAYVTKGDGSDPKWLPLVEEYLKIHAKASDSPGESELPEKVISKKKKKGVTASSKESKS